MLGGERHGEAVTLSCSDTDAALSALFRSFPGVRDVEVHGASLEEAFFELTGEERDDLRDGKSEAPRPGKEGESR